MTTEEMFTLLINEIRDIKSDISSLKSDVANLKNDVTSLKNDVSELKNGQSRLEDRMNNFEVRMDRMENDIAELKAGQKSLNDKIEKRFNETAEQVGKVVDALSAEDNKYAEKIDELETLTKWNTTQIIKMLSHK